MTYKAHHLVISGKSINSDKSSTILMLDNCILFESKYDKKRRDQLTLRENMPPLAKNNLPTYDTTSNIFLFLYKFYKFI